MKDGKQLAMQLVQEFGLKAEILEAVKQDVIYKSLLVIPGYTFTLPINKGEPQIVAELEAWGFHVYHVVSSILQLDGGLTMTSTAYLLVPLDIPKSLGYAEEDFLFELERMTVIEDYTNRCIKAAKNGIAFAWVVNDEWGVREFGDVVLQNVTGGLARIG